MSSALKTQPQLTVVETAKKYWRNFLPIWLFPFWFICFGFLLALANGYVFIQYALMGVTMLYFYVRRLLRSTVYGGNRC